MVLSLKETKKLLSIDQLNILACVVLTDFDDHTNIRTPDGSKVRASKDSGSSFVAGSTVEVRTDKRTYNIIGDSSYADYAAQRSLAL